MLGASSKAERGFSMLEVLVTMLVIMFGVLSLAGLQLMAVSNTEAARYQGAASLLAASMVASVQTNQAYWATPPSSTITVNNTAVTNGPAAYGGTCVSNVCSGAQLAYYDLKNWGVALAGALPNGQASIACDSTVLPAVCTITLTWFEKNIALTNPTGTESGALASGTAATRTYQTLVSMI